MNRRNYYTGKLVDTALMEDLQNIVEDSVVNIQKIFGPGIYFGGTISTTGNPLVLSINSTVCFDVDGNRIVVPAANLPAVTLATSTQKWASIVVTFDRRSYQVEKDFYNINQYFKQDDFYAVTILYSAENASPVKPVIASNQILLTDVLIDTSSIVSRDQDRVTKYTATVLDHFNDTSNPHDTGLSQLSDYDADNNTITNVTSGSNPNDLVNKEYVDSSGKIVLVENLTAGNNTISVVSKASGVVSEWKYTIWYNSEVRSGVVTSMMSGNYDYSEYQTTYTANVSDIAFSVASNLTNLDFIVNVPNTGWNIKFIETVL